MNALAPLIIAAALIARGRPAGTPWPLAARVMAMVGTAIVAGAVGMVEMALAELQKNGVVHLDEERKAQMVSNLLVVLCGERATQPIVNAGSLY